SRISCTGPSLSTGSPQYRSRNAGWALGAGPLATTETETRHESTTANTTFLMSFTSSYGWPARDEDRPHYTCGLEKLYVPMIYWALTKHPFDSKRRGKSLSMTNFAIVSDPRRSAK